MKQKPIEELIGQSEDLTDTELTYLDNWFWGSLYSTSSRVQERRRRAGERIDQETNRRARP